MPGYAPPEGWTPKLRIGPSVLDQAGRCMRSWGLRYLLGYDSYDPTWADLAEHTYDSAARLWRRKGFPDYPPRKRSCALGTEAHAIVEMHYLGQDVGPRWASFPGQVAQAWLDVMPRPDECDEMFTEIGVTLWPEDGGPPIEGTSDLLLKVKPAAAAKHFDVSAFAALEMANWWLVGDWKSTSAWKYAKNAATLFTDRQGVVYPLAAMRRLELDAIPGRWAYSLTDAKARRQARATDFVQTRENAEALARGYFAEAAALKEHFDAFTFLPIQEDRESYVAILPANTDACDAYGGCPHAWDRGGACMARRSLGARVQACVKPPTCATEQVVPLNQLLQKSLDRGAGDKNMTSPWMQAKQRFQAQQAAASLGTAALDPPALADVADEPAENTAVETPDSKRASEPPVAPALTPAAAPVVEAPKRRGRPPGAKNRAVGMPPALAAPYGRGEDASAHTVVASFDAAGVAKIAAGTMPPTTAVTAVMLEGLQPLAQALVDAPDPPTQPEPTPDLTLAHVAQVARTTGAEITIRFDGEKMRAWA